MFAPARASQTNRRDDVAPHGSAAVPARQHRVSLVPVHTAKIFHERFPTLGVCEIPFHTSRDSVELSIRNELFEEKLFCRTANVLSGVL